MNLTDTRAVGRSAVRITPLGLGGTALGNIYQAVTEADARATIAAAYQAGVRYFDTAPLYGHGLSETRLGKGLAGLPRGELVISTKVGYALTPQAQTQAGSLGAFVDPLPNAISFDYSRDGARRSLEGSLRRLQTDHVEIVLIHDPDESTSLERGVDPYARSHFAEVMAGAYPALHDLRSQGVIKAIGLGMNQWQMLLDFARAGDFDCFLLAGRYTLLEQLEAAPLMEHCRDHQISLIIGGPYNSGILATGAVAGAYYNYSPAPDDVLAQVRRIEAVCARHAVPLAAAALQFPLAHPAVAGVIPGARSAAEVAANVRLWQYPIPAIFWQELRAEGLIAPDVPVPA
ncbi:MAG: aldo/keto reductase [Anaerolineales bacterium]|nr:aldo/keto reductase [Anaerolineales bacterium]